MNRSKRFPRFLTLLLMFALLTASSTFAQQPTPTRQQQPPPAASPTPSRTPRPQSATPTPAQSATPTPMPARAPAAPASAVAPVVAPAAVPAKTEVLQTAGVNFDELVADDSYMLFGEVRSVSGLLQTSLVSEALAPFIQLDEVPRELGLLRSFAERHSETLDNARIYFAAQPARPGLPSVLIAVRCADEPAARLLAPNLRRLIDELIAAPAAAATPVTVQTATPQTAPRQTPTVQPPTAQAPASQATTSQAPQNPPKPAGAPAAPRYIIKQSGDYVFGSDTAFEISALKLDANSTSLAANTRYQQAQAQLASAPLFFYYDLKATEREMRRTMKEQQERMEKAQRENEEVMEKEKQERIARGETVTNEEMVITPDEIPVIPAKPDEDMQDADDDDETLVKSVPEGVTPVVVQAPTVANNQDADAALGAGNSGVAFPSLGVLLPSFLGGGSSAPMFGGAEAMGMGLSLDGEAAAMKFYFVTPDQKRINPIPLLPVLVSGEPSASRAATLLPANTDMFISMSLDASETYDRVIGAFDAAATDIAETTKKAATDGAESTAPKITSAQLGIALVEQRYGFKIKDELLSSLGNEIAVGVLRSPPPASQTSTATAAAVAGNTASSSVVAQSAAEKESDEPTLPETRPSSGEGFALFISVTDRERLKRVLPKVMEAAGINLPNVAAANMFQKRGDIETFTFAGGNAAFVADFLVLASDQRVLDRVAESAGGSSLATSTSFVNSRAWQPREKLAEIFVAMEFADTLISGERSQLAAFATELTAFFETFTTTPEPITYALSGDTLGTLHEVRVPRSTIISFAAQAAADAKHGEKLRNERYANYRLTALAGAQDTYRKKNKRYGSLDDLRKAELIYETDLTSNGYIINLNVSPETFEATATPTQYGITGRRSFYINTTNTLRAADHAGKPADANDPEAK